MATQIPEEVLQVFYAETVWEDGETPAILLFAEFYNDPENIVFMMLRLAEALAIGSPPDLATETNDWCVFILNEFVEFGADYGINNIKSIIKLKDRIDISDDAEARINTGTYIALDPVFNEIREELNNTLARTPCPDPNP